MDHDRHFVAVYTDCRSSEPIALAILIETCNHKHPTVAGATACIREAGGYVLAVCDGDIVPLSDSEEGEFLRALCGYREPDRAEAESVSLFRKLNPQE